MVGHVQIILVRLSVVVGFMDKVVLLVGRSHSGWSNSWRTLFTAEDTT